MPVPTYEPDTSQLYGGYTREFYHRAIKNNRERARIAAEEKAAQRTRIYELEREVAALRAQIAEREKLAIEQSAHEKELTDTLRVMETVVSEIQKVPHRHTVKQIEARACKVFKIRPSELRSAGRQREVVFARQFVCYWARRLTSNSYPSIGRFLGGRDHTTAIHAATVYPQKRAKQGRFLRAVR